MARTKSGLEVLIEQKMDLVRGKRIGLVTNHSAVTYDLVHAVDALRGAGVNIAALFAPEHGVRGDAPAGREIPDSTDPATGLPVYSLFGRVRKPTPEMLRGLDAVYFDIQDIGCRFYTFIYTMSFVMQACAENGKPFVVLDRPNPIGGRTVEGNIPEKQFTSGVGLHPIPIRHGMSMGELAILFNGEYFFGAELNVVPCMGWRRILYFDETELPWVMPSPAMPTLETALLYPGTCLLEGTNISEGRGTSKPFEMVGAPWINGKGLADSLNDLKLPGLLFRPAYFTPSSSKFAQQQCSGIQAHITEKTEVQPVKMGLHVIRTVREMYPEQFQFLPAGAAGKPFFDLLAGTDKIRLALQSKTPVDEIIGFWASDQRAFMEIRKKYLIYM